MGIDKIKSQESIENEKFIKLQEAIGEYSEQKIAKLSTEILEKFSRGEVKLDEPSGYTHPQVVYRNFIYALISDINDAPDQRDDLNFTLFGLAIKKAMDQNPEFDKFVRDYINLAIKADAEAWEEKDTTYAKTVAMDRERNPRDDGHEREYLLNPNDDRYVQGKIMAKYILGE